MAYMQGQEPMLYTQPEAEGSFDHSHQKPSATQQTQPSQQRTPNHNQKQQVRSLPQYTVNSDHAQKHGTPTIHLYIPSIAHDTRAPLAESCIQETTKSYPWNHTQNNNQIKSHDYWLHPPPPQTANRFDALTEDDQDEGGEKATN